MKIIPLLLLLVGASAAPVIHAAELQLPDPLVTQSGERVTTPAAWQTTRRPEVLELFRKHVYGRAPVGRPADLKFEVFDSAPDAMDGKATRKQVKITWRGPGGEGALRLVLFIPNGAKKPAPCFLLICNRPAAENIDPTRAVKSPFWPAEEIVARGYVAAAFFNGDVVPDQRNAFESGIFKIYDTAPRPADAWGAIAAWAWGASRALDYLVTDAGIDGKRVAVVGHSRGGKTALWAGAEDGRFAMVVSNDSGSTGAALARGKQGERIHDINRGFPHWFNENYKAFAGREEELPLDQHMLGALIAPRLLYIASATEDTWADPKSEFLSGVHATPAFRLFGLEGLTSANLPNPEAPLHDGRIGYHLRTGKHNLTEYDWGRFMDFADKHLGQPAPHAYEVVRDWPGLPEGRELGLCAGIGVDSHDRVFVFHRNERAWSTPFPDEPIPGPTVAVFDGKGGRLLAEWGAGEFIMPHGLTLDQEDHVWLTDVGRHQVFKFTRDGRLLLTLGVHGKPGADRTHFNLPTDVAVLPDGSFYVSDGYRNARVVKFDAAGRYEFEWGGKGSEPGKFNLPHGIAVDARGRVFVCDRSNARLQVFEPLGQFIAEWKGPSIGRPYGVSITADGHVFTIDGDGAKVVRFDGDGKVVATFGSAGAEPGKFQLGHDIAAARDGSVYVAEGKGKRVQKFIPKAP